MRSVAFVSGNDHKAKEIIAMGKERGIKIAHIKLPKVEIQSDSNAEIAMKSAMEAYRNVKKPLIVDDSGLFIRSLGGFPGIYSAYVYKTVGIAGVLRLLHGARDRSAQYRTSFCYTDGKTTKLFEGANPGTISKRMMGARKLESGLASMPYDVIFIPKGYKKTFSMLSVNLKNRISSRSVAFNKFADFFLKSQKA
ncbi:MAG: non-canonical purine NTP pyrophosphatase [Candidatus Micrarchaeota archaeon]|nr:non-canonical purine NTP pyrophosphatase [Candidatus Micrarchaeota archaeon]